MIAALLSEAWPYIAAIGAILAAALGLYANGRKDAGIKRDLSDVREYQKTLERMADAPADTDADIARKRMRDRPQGQP